LSINGDANGSASTPLSTRSASSPFLRLMVQADDHNSKAIQQLKLISRFVFSLTITTTFIIMEFILIQFMRGSPDNHDGQIDSLSMFVWNASIHIMVLSLIFVQPLIVIVLLVHKFFKAPILNKLNIKAASSSVIMIAWLIFVSKFDTFTDLNDGTFLVGLDNFRLVLVHKISVIGITLIAILNGIGSYSTFYYYLYKYFKNGRWSNNPIDAEVTRERLLELKRTLDQTEILITEKEIELSDRDSSSDPNLQKRTNIQPNGSFMDLQILNKLSYNKNDELSKEIRSLVKIKNDVFYKILKIESSLNSNTYLNSNSSYGKSQILIQGLVQKILAIYCSFKIIQVTIVTIISFYQSYNEESTARTKESDPLVITVSKIVQLFITVQDENFLVNLLSFFVSGALFICSFNGVFITLRHLYKFIPIDLSNLEKSTSPIKYKSVSIIKNLIISELMGVYGLATLLIMRSSLTKDFSSTLNTLFVANESSSSARNISKFEDINLIDNWFDKVFLASVAVTITGIRLSEVFSNDDEGFENHDLLEKIV
jgi:hypothetical protein